MECPDRMQKAKKIKMLPTLEPRSIKLLDESEMMGEVRKLTLPTTLDTGAHYTLIPEGMVDPKDFTGKTAKLNTWLSKLLVRTLRTEIGRVKRQ